METESIKGKECNDQNLIDVKLWSLKMINILILCT